MEGFSPTLEPFPDTKKRVRASDSKDPTQVFIEKENITLHHDRIATVSMRAEARPFRVLIPDPILFRKHLLYTRWLTVMSPCVLYYQLYIDRLTQYTSTQYRHE